jgi:hypothetical protein
MFHALYVKFSVLLRWRGKISAVLFRPHRLQCKEIPKFCLGFQG